MLQEIEEGTVSRRRKDVRYHVVGGGRDADGPVWFVMRRGALHDWKVATARTRAAARQTARELARAATPARSDAGDGLDVRRLAATEPWLADIVRCAEAAFAKWEAAHRNEANDSTTFIEAEAATPGESRTLVEALDALEREFLDALPPAGHPIVRGIFQRLPDRLRAALAEVPVIPNKLGAAWAEAEAALPEGWVIECGNFPDGRGWAQALGPEANSQHPSTYERADTPAAALHALAAALSEPPQ